MNTQLTHHQVDTKEQTYSISLLTDRISSPANLGGIFRAADAFGIENLFLYGKGINLSTPRFEKAARSTIFLTKNFQVENPLEVIHHHKTDGYLILALEITSQSISLNRLEILPCQKILLIAGSEKYGISNEILGLSDQTLHIDMMGKNSSMNVTNAISIALYSITQKLVNDK